MSVDMIIMWLCSSMGCQVWKYTIIFLFAILLECQCLEMRTRVDIMSSRVLDDHLLVTCSVSSTSKSTSSYEDLRSHNVYLHCPLLGDDKICYINCDSLLVTEQGIPIHTKVFSSCQQTWSLQDRVEFQYLLNRRFIGLVGDWYCVYKNLRSTNVTIQRIITTKVTSTTTLTYAPLKGHPTEARTCNQTTACPIESGLANIIAGTICAFCVSAICNILLVIVFCLTKCENDRASRRQLSKDGYQSPTERFSLLSKNCHRPRDLNRSICSRTPSLDTPSNKESLSTYMQDTIHSGSCKPSSAIHIHPDHSYRIFEIIPPNLGYRHIDRSSQLPLSDGDDPRSVGDIFVPSVHVRQIDPHRMSAQYSCGSFSIHDSSPHQIPIVTGRPFNSHQQLHRDSNEESGLGSDLTYHGYQLGTLYNGPSSKVDLIQDCEVTDITKRSALDS